MKNVFLLFLLFAVISCKSNDRQGDDDLKVEQSSQVATIFKVPEIPEEITFAGEVINLRDVDLRERFDRELIVNNFWHSNTIMYLKRSNRWFPLIQTILRENDVPEDFAYLAVIESGLTQATSPSGAKGFWQFMKGTAQEYDLIVNREIDERLNIEKSTHAACRYLKKAYDEFGTWSLAAASYNMGMNGVRKALEEQKVSSYFDLLLNEETSRYVFRMLAIKEIMLDPVKFGFNIESDQLYPVHKVKKIVVNETISDLSEWSAKMNLSLKVIRKLNPWILKNYIHPKRYDGLTLLIPTDHEQLGRYEG